MTPPSPARTAERDDTPAAAVAAAALERAVETAWALLVDAAEIASRATGGPVRIDVDPRRWADGADTNAQAIGRVLLNASVEAERLIAIGQSAHATRPAPPVLAPFVIEPPPASAPPMPAPRPPAPAPRPPAPRPPAPALAPAVRTVLAGPPAPVRPVTLPEGLSRKRVVAATALTWLVGAAVLTLLFVAYQLWGTGLSEARAQNTLGADFKAALTHSAANTAQISSKLIVVPPPKHLPGDAVGRIQIPKIGVDKYVVEGTERDDLEQGPGHYIGSSQPGHPGNVAIAGHRTTYGAPFNRLDELGVGSDIYLTTVEGRFLYKVSEEPFPVSPYNNSVVQDYGDNRLTLTTCNPKFSAAQRLIVVAKFVGKNPIEHRVPVKVNPATGGHNNTGVTPVATAGATHVETGASDGWGGGAPLVAFWLAVVVGLGLAYKPLRRHWPALAVYAVIVPAWVCVLFLFFEQLNRFLPANL
jgi:sortase A